MSILSDARPAFSLSSLAMELRKKFPQLEKVHDDYLCVSKFSDMVSFNITVGGCDLEILGDTCPLTKTFVERLFAERKRLIDQYTKEAELRHAELKKRVVDLSQIEPELAKLKDLPNGEVSTVMDVIKTVDALRSAINGYYKVKVEGEGGPEFFKKLGEIFFTAVRSLSSGQQIETDIFAGELMFLKEPINALAELFNSTEDNKEGLIVQINTILKSIKAGAVLPDSLFGEHLEFLKEPLNKFLVILTVVKSDKDSIPAREELINRFEEIIKLLLNGTAFPQGIFTDDTKFLQDPMMKISKLFMAVKPQVRTELISRFILMMKALLSCFVLYRFPVNIAMGQKPIYFSRFISTIKLAPFLQLYGLDLSALTLTP